MPCRSTFSCTEHIRRSTAAGYLHVEVELIIGLLDGGVLTQAGRELWQLHSIALVNTASNMPLITSRPLEEAFQEVWHCSEL